MRLLLDTHVFLWAVSDNPKLSASARRTISNAEAVYVSAASIWEIAIKTAIGKIEADPDELAHAIEASGFIPLPITPIHAARVAKLPLLNDHKDPFDRLLVAQSLTEPLVLLSADAKIKAYGGLVEAV